jgi:hypothetical protein
MVLFGDEDQRRGEKLLLLEGCLIGEVEDAPRTMESPGLRVVCVRGQLRRVIGAECEAETAAAELGVEGPVGGRADGAEDK